MMDINPNPELKSVDAVKVIFNLQIEVELDLVRLLQDPLWQTLVNTEGDMDVTLCRYLSHYLELGGRFPSSNGPPGLLTAGVEKIHPTSYL